MKNTVDYALEYAAKGWHVFPLHPIDPETRACGCNRAGCEGKHPLFRDWIELATNDKDQIIAWWNGLGERGIGILTGYDSGVVVLDIDPRNDGDRSLLALVTEHGALPPTYVVETGGGGTHFYFKHPGGRIPSRRLGDGLDFKADTGSGGRGHFVVAPPSLHQSGEVYRIRSNFPLVTVPEWILRIQSQTIRLSSDADPMTIPNGQRHTTLLAFIGRQRHAGLLRSETLERARTVNMDYCETPISEEELVSLVDSVYSYDRSNYTCDDMGNMRRFANTYKGTLRYCIDTQQWHYHDWYWRPLPKEELGSLSDQVIDNLTIEPSLAADPIMKEKLQAWAKKCRFAERMRALQDRVVHIPQLQVRLEDLNPDPGMLCVRNGLIDLRTGRQHPHNNDIHTLAVNLPYVENAESKVWNRFLLEANNEDKEQVAFMQLAVGYTLTGRTDEEILFFIQGPGGTGKTTFVEAIRSVMGDYAQTIPTEVLLRKRFSGSGQEATPEFAKLVGARLVVAAEMQQGAHLDVGVVKRLTGGDSITARQLHKNPFTFVPQFKIWMTMNKLPFFQGDDTGMKRRLITLPFLHVPARPDFEMKRLFRSDVPTQQAILSWAVKGAIRWFAGERVADSIPTSAVDMREDYFENLNPLLTYMKTFRETKRGERRVYGTTEIFNKFKTYCEKRYLRIEDTQTPTLKAMGAFLKEKGFKHDTATNKWNLTDLEDLSYLADLPKEQSQ